MAQRQALLLPLPSRIDWTDIASQSKQKDAGNDEPIEYRRFRPYKPFIVYRINERVHPSTLLSFIRQAKDTPAFILYSLRQGIHQHDETIEIAVNLLEKDTSLSVVFHIELSAITAVSSFDYLTSIQDLFQTIFHPSESIFTWNEQYINLDSLFDRHVLPRRPSETARFIPMHDTFKQWYYRSYRHESACAKALTESTNPKICSCHGRILFSFYYQWTLEHAIKALFQETIENASFLMSEILVKGPVMSAKDSPIRSVLYCLAIFKLGKQITRKRCQSQEATTNPPDSQ